MVNGGYPRAFRREGLLARALPFGVVSVVGLLLIALAGPRPDVELAIQAALYIIALSALVVLVPWDRLPRWTDLLPPLAFLVVLWAMRSHVGFGFASLTVAPLFLVPTFWVALHGMRVDVAILLVLGGVLRFVPLLVEGTESGELGYAVAAYLVTATVCILTSRVVREHRLAAATVRDMIDQLPVGYLVSRAGRIVYANRALADALGRTPGEMIGADTLRDVHSDERMRAIERGRRVMDGERVPSTDVRFLHRDGSEIVLESQPIAIRFAERRAVGIVLRDVTELRAAEVADSESRATLALERAQMAAILSTIRDGVALLDEHRRGVLANQAYLDLFGFTEAEFKGMGREQFLDHLGELVADPDELSHVSDFGHPDESNVITFVRPRRRVMRRTLTPVVLRNGIGMLAVWTDVTAERDLIASAEHDAVTDALTGLINRRGAAAAVARELARARRDGGSLSLVLLDIDHFKVINDRFGHDEGDRVLCAVAHALAEQARASDTVARWGGEEFLAVLPGPPAGARVFFDRVRDALAHLDLGRVGHVTISAGIAELGADDRPEAILDRADRNLYEAKHAGRDRIAG